MTLNPRQGCCLDSGQCFVTLDSKHTEQILDWQILEVDC